MSQETSSGTCGAISPAPEGRATLSPRALQDAQVPVVQAPRGQTPAGGCLLEKAPALRQQDAARPAVQVQPAHKPKGWLSYMLPPSERPQTPPSGRPPTPVPPPPPDLRCCGTESAADDRAFTPGSFLSLQHFRGACIPKTPCLVFASALALLGVCAYSHTDTAGSPGAQYAAYAPGGAGACIPKTPCLVFASALALLGVCAYSRTDTAGSPGAQYAAYARGGAGACIPKNPCLVFASALALLGVCAYSRTDTAGLSDGPSCTFRSLAVGSAFDPVSAQQFEQVPQAGRQKASRGRGGSHSEGIGC